jgi:ribosomal protein S18 acetylase RimI-like enzyme
MAGTVVIRRLAERDLWAVADVHLAAFPASALTRIGREAVRRYYHWLLTGPHDVTALGAFIDEELDGFCFGGRFNGAMAGFLRQNRTFLACRVALRPWLLRDAMFRERLRFARRSWRRLRKRRSTAGASQALAPDQPCFGILSIAVHPTRQGTGVGHRLMLAAETAARECGYRTMDLTVDPANLKGIQFYRRLHWRQAEDLGPWTGRMTKSLDG